MAKKETNCSFCGSPRSSVNMLIAGVNGHICDSCASQASKIVQEELAGAASSGQSAQQGLNLLKPQEIKAHLDQYVIGQQDAKKVLSCSLQSLQAPQAKNFRKRSRD